MPNPSKRIKTDIGPVATALIEQSNVKRKVARRRPTHLFDLNVDVLFAIFERLDVMDLPNVVASCGYLKSIVFDTFKRKHKNLKLVFSDIIVGNIVSEMVRKRNRAIRLFETFGSLIIELEVIFDYWYDAPNGAFIIDSIVENCTSLKAFELESFKVPNNQFWFVRMQQLFIRLQKLYLRNVYLDDGHWHYGDMLTTSNGNAVTFLNNCASLVELKLCQSLYEPAFRSFFPKLESFVIEDPGGHVTDNMDAFIIRHPNLKVLILDWDMLELPVATANLPSLEKFGFRFDDFGFRSVEILAKFRNLKELTCFVVGWQDEMSQLLKVLPALANSLEVLNLRNGCGNRDFIKIVNSLPNLKVIRLHDIEINDTSTDQLKDLLRATVIIE